MTIDQKLRQIEQQLARIDSEEPERDGIADELTRLMEDYGCTCRDCDQEWRDLLDTMTEDQMRTEYVRCLMFVIRPQDYPEITQDFERRHIQVGPYRRRRLGSVANFDFRGKI